MEWLNDISAWISTEWPLFLAGMAPYANFAAAVSAIAAAIAAFISLKQLSAARIANEATVLLAMADRYNAPEMGEALRTLRDYHRQHHASGDFATTWKSSCDAREPEALALNEARRLVSRYFVDVARLSKNRVISRRVSRALTAHNGYFIYHFVCEPMSAARDPVRETAHAKQLRKIRQRYGKRRLRHFWESAEKDVALAAAMHT